MSEPHRGREVIPSLLAPSPSPPSLSPEAVAAILSPGALESLNLMPVLEMKGKKGVVPSGVSSLESGYGNSPCSFHSHLQGRSGFWSHVARAKRVL